MHAGVIQKHGSDVAWMASFIIQSISNPVLSDAGHHSFDIPGSVSEGIIPAAGTGKIHGRRTIQRNLLCVRFSVPGSDRGVRSGRSETAQRIPAADEKDKTIRSQGVPAGYKRHAIQAGSG